jgi:hypothetical protein
MLKTTALIPPIQVRKIPILRVGMAVAMPVNAKVTSMAMQIVTEQMQRCLKRTLGGAHFKIPALTSLYAMVTLTVTWMWMEVMPLPSKMILAEVLLVIPALIVR